MKKIAIVCMFFLLGQKLSFAQEVCITAMEKKVLLAINDFRKSNGLEPLQISRTLMLTANKNAETMANQTYTDFKVTQFGNYAGRTQKIKMATSVTTYEQIVSTLTLPSEYNKNAKILANTGEFAQFSWKAIGISLRKSSDASVPTVICVYVGESAEDVFNPKICTQEELYFSPNVQKLPDRVEVVVKELEYRFIKIKVKNRVSWYLYGFKKGSEEGKELDNGVFDIKLDSSRHAVYGDKPNYEVGTISIIVSESYNDYDYFEVYYFTRPKPIIPPFHYTFRISKAELMNAPQKEVWYNLDYTKGNTLKELKAYLQEDPKNLYLPDAPYKYTVLHRAVMQDCLECVDYLLNEKGVDVNLEASGRVVPMALCKSNEMFDLLMTKKPRMNVVNEVNYTLLHDFAGNNIMKGVKYMVEVQKADINAKDRQGGTPLHHAVRESNYEIVKYLLSKGAKHTFGWGRYPIHYAIENVDIPMLKILLEGGGRNYSNLPDDSGYYPLYTALFTGNLELINLLIENGANLEQKMKDSYGRTLRIVDFYNNHVSRKKEVIDYLKSKGVKFN